MRVFGLRRQSAHRSTRSRAGGHRSIARATMAMGGALTLAIGSAVAAHAAVSTDRWEYHAGDTVQISGDGMSAGEAVTVVVFLPDGAVGQKHTVAADASGDFVDSYTLPTDSPDGIYQVAAVGRVSGHVYRTSFDPGVSPDCLQFDNHHHFHAVNPTATGGTDTITVSWTDACSNEYGYVVQRNDGTATGWTTVATVVAGPDYSSSPPQGATLNYEDGLTPGDCTTYSYRVEAITDVGQLPTSTSNPSSGATALGCDGGSGAVTPTLTTTPLDANDPPEGTPFVLASAVHDHIAVSATNGTPTGSVSVELYKGSDCTDQKGEHLTAYDEPSLSLSDGAADSSATDPLHAGSYYYLVTYTSDTTGSWDSVTTPDCEEFTVDKADVLLSTTPYADAGDTVATPFHLGDQVHDTATIAGIESETAGFEPVGSVSFTFYGDNTAGNTSVGDCSDTASAAGSAAVNSSSPVDPVTVDSDTATTPLHAGDYGFTASYTDSSGDYNDYTADPTTTDCEQITVGSEATTTTTTLRDSDGVPLPGTVALVGSDGTFHVHDSSATAATSGNEPFDFSGTSTFKFFANGGCTAPANTSTGASVGTDGTATESPEHALAPGSYCWNAAYGGNGDYESSQSSNEPLTVLPHSTVTDSSLCTFDTDPATAATKNFNLIYTPDTTGSGYKLNASNPGQFYFNVFSPGTAARTVTLTVPAPFVTRGAVPIHVYSGVAVSTSGPMCFTPGTEIANSSQSITATGGTSHTLTVQVPETLSGYAYVNLHLDFGYKGSDNCTRGTTPATANDASCTTPATATIPNSTPYAFSSDADSVGDSVANVNVFKKDPGIGGLVTKKSDTSPVKSALVQIYDGSNHLLGTASTDADGWYMWSYKYTGKAATFVVKTNGLSQSMTLKSNGFLIVNFSV